MQLPIGSINCVSFRNAPLSLTVQSPDSAEILARFWITNSLSLCPVILLVYELADTANQIWAF